jgi:hypothetical protein
MLFDEFVGWNGHDDFARMVFDEIRQREHRDIPQSADQADKDEKSEEARHGRGPATGAQGAISSVYDDVP